MSRDMSTLHCITASSEANGAAMASLQERKHYMERKINQLEYLNDSTKENLRTSM